MRHIQYLCVVASIFLAGCVTERPQLVFPQVNDSISVGTGGTRGFYHPAGRIICGLVNDYTKDHGLDCVEKITKGSSDNLRALRSGSREMGIAQSDWHYRAYKGENTFSKDGENKNLRSVFSMYPEPATLVVRSDSGIKSIEDLVGKTVHIGNYHSDSELYWNLAWSALGKSERDFTRATPINTGHLPSALCFKKIDAYFYMVGNPNPITTKAVEDCGAIVVPVDGPAIEKLVRDNPYLRQARIPGKTYDTVLNDVKTYGVGATLVTTAEVPADQVYILVKSIFENFEWFRNSHFIFSDLRKEEMVKDSLSAPLHEGAARYYREAGLLQ